MHIQLPEGCLAVHKPVSPMSCRLAALFHLPNGGVQADVSAGCNCALQLSWDCTVTLLRHTRATASPLLRFLSVLHMTA